MRFAGVCYCRTDLTLDNVVDIQRGETPEDVQRLVTWEIIWQTIFNTNEQTLLLLFL